MSRPPIRTALLIALAVPAAVVGIWGLIAPAGFHATFPGGGRHWLPPLGPYNEHLMRDFAAAYLALAALLTIGALKPKMTARRAAPAVFLVFALPHFIYHVLHTEGLATGDNIVNLIALALTVVIPIALLAIPEENTAA